MASTLAKASLGHSSAFAVQSFEPSKRSHSTQPVRSSPASRKRHCQKRSLQSFDGLRASCAISGRSTGNASDLFKQRVSAATLPDGVPPQEMRGRKGQTVCTNGMKLVFVSAEVAPWSKTGGLGDVLGGLPPALAARGHRVMTVSPRYDQYKDAWDTDVTVDLKVGDKIETVRFFHCYKRGVDRVFVDHPLFLAKVWGKTGGKIYGNKTGEDFQDNQLRFSLFAQAAIEAPRVLNLTNSPHYDQPYGEDVVFIANDWHTALLPCYLKSQYQGNGQFTNAKVAFCVHNIAYQGRFAPDDFNKLNLPDRFRESFHFEDGYAIPVAGNKINWMKAAFLEADKVLTVSPNYASELVSGPDKGVELDDVVSKVNIKGIVNGMDVAEWDPSSDKYLDQTYDLDSVLETKPILKEALQAEVGLPIDPSKPLIGFIGRLEEQKGSDILAGAVGDIVKAGAQLVVLGTGKKYLEKQLDELDAKFPEGARGIVKFNVPLAHLIIAGADFLVVPSRFEPCGLIQLQAMRYGTIPIVASTGGLVDTVTEGVTGFHMGELDVDCESTKPEDVEKVVSGVTSALKVYGTPKFDDMIKSCMKLNLSWENPAKEWEAELLNLGVAYSKPGKEGVELYPKTKESLATP